MAEGDSLSAEAEKLKAEGNEHFKNGNFLKAAAFFTKGLKESPNSAVLYSNRSAAFRAIGKVKRSVEDAEQCIKLKPEWSKGYYRLGLALVDLDEPERALQVLKEGEQVDPKSKEIKLKIQETLRVLREKEKIRLAESERTRTEFKATDSDADQYITSVIEEVRNSFAADITQSGVIAYFGDLSASGIDRAFDSPDTLQKCTEFLRGETKKRNSSRLSLAVRKSSIGYPRVWTSHPWSFGEEDGIFIQMHSSKRSEQKVLFLALNNLSKLIPYELDFEKFRFMPDVIVEDLP